MLKVGDTAPEFELPDQTGTVVRLNELLAKGPVVLFFYPAAFTPGCTAESCHFRDLAGEFEKAGGQRVGISADAVSKQKDFAEKYTFDYPLLSDADRSVAEQFGVKRGFGPLPVKRATFVIATDGRIAEVIKSEIRMDKHADEALAALAKLGR